jgi:transposase
LPVLPGPRDQHRGQRHQGLKRDALRGFPARSKRGAKIDPRGYDAGKKIKGKKRHIVVDTQGLLMEAIVHSADIQDRDGGALLMTSLFGLFPFLLKLYADGGYQGPGFQRALKTTLARVRVEIVKRCDQAKAFVVLPKRWIVDGSTSSP